LTLATVQLSISIEPPVPPAKEQKKRFEKKDRRRCLFILRSPTYGGGSERKVGINVTSFERQNFL